MQMNFATRVFLNELSPINPHRLKNPLPPSSFAMGHGSPFPANEEAFMEEQYPGYEAADERKGGVQFISRTKMSFFNKFQTPAADRPKKRKVRVFTYACTDFV